MKEKDLNFNKTSALSDDNFDGTVGFRPPIAALGVHRLAGAQFPSLLAIRNHRLFQQRKTEKRKEKSHRLHHHQKKRKYLEREKGVPCPNERRGAPRRRRRSWWWGNHPRLGLSMFPAGRKGAVLQGVPGEVGAWHCCWHPSLVLTLVWLSFLCNL